MSSVTTTRVSARQYALAIAGGTGDLGRDITRVLLKEYKPFFSPIIVLTRSASSPTAKSLVAGGAVIREVDLSGNATTEEHDKQLRESLNGVDVLIDTLAHYVEPAKLRVFKAALDAGVKVYFPSEFGVDYRKNEQIFTGYDHSIWISKRGLLTEFQRLAAERGGVPKVVPVACGLFLETIGASIWLSPTIPPNTPVAWTSKPDIGRALAELALLALAPETAPSIPEYVRISGPNYSAAEYARAAGEAPSANEHEKDLASVEARLRKEKAEGDEKTPENYIRVLMALGELDWSKPGTNDNELFNPGGSLWRWQDVNAILKQRKENQ